MKTLKYIIMGAILWLGSSCGDSWLNLESSTSVSTDGAIKELKDINLALNGIYSSMQNSSAYTGRLVYYGDATGDDMQAVSATKRTGSAYMFSFTKDNSPSSYWSYPYYMITMCNVILSQIDNLKVKEDEKELRDAYKGETLALRGMFLFELTRLYGYPYKKDKGASLGVPVLTEVLDESAKPSRNTVAECYNRVIEDLKEGAALLDNVEGSSYHKGHINRWGALTLLSRVYLYHGDDALALAAAEEAIKGAESEGYALWTNEEYATAWGNDASKSKKGEVLFEIVNTTEEGPGKESLGYLHSADGYDDIAVTSSFYAMMKEDPADVRNQLFRLDKNAWAYLFKYQPQAGETIDNANVPLLRLSETYLNAAEAAVKTKDNTKAVKYLDAIVRRANPANTVEGTTVTIERVMLERRKELVGEGHRMYDALRDGGYVDRYDVDLGEELTTKHLTLSDQQKKHFNWDYFKCVLAIPKAECDANPNIVQNPEYGN